jgi:hypothetical protein
MAFGESAQVLAAKVYAAMNTQHSIDFINHAVANIPFSVHTVSTDRDGAFQGEFEQHLVKLSIRHELVISDRERIENPLGITVRSISPVSPRYMGIIERHFRAANEDLLRRLFEQGIINQRSIDV